MVVLIIVIEIWVALTIVGLKFGSTMLHLILAFLSISVGMEILWVSSNLVLICLIS